MQMATNSSAGTIRKQKRSQATVNKQLGPFELASPIHGVSFDGRHVWFTTDGKLHAADPDTGGIVRTVEIEGADAGTAFDGKYLWQLAGVRILKIDPATGAVVGSIAAPGEGRDSGMAWADGALWVGEYREGRLHKIDPATGTIVKTLKSDRFVTGVTWSNGALWHGAWTGDRADGQRSELRRVDTNTGEVLEAIEMPEGTLVSGIESDGRGGIWCGDHDHKRLLAVAVT